MSVASTENAFHYATDPQKEGKSAFFLRNKVVARIFRSVVMQVKS